MNTVEILAYVDEEIVRLEQVKALLNGQPPEKAAKGKPGPKPGKKAGSAVKVIAIKATGTRKRKMSAEGRARIAAAQKARWAAANKSS